MHAVVLKYFLEVARSGSIRKAAPSLFVASSAVNCQILEAELGTGLFDRVPSGMRLNMAGERLQQHVRATLHDFHLMAPSSTRSRVSAGAMCRWLRWTPC